MVYPAVDSVFQNAVMSIADFLQSHRELNVIIDVWQRGSLAEQGPLRWLNSQVRCAEKVLIILPPQNHKFSTDTGNMLIGTFPFKHAANSLTLAHFTGLVLAERIPLCSRIFSHDPKQLETKLKKKTKNPKLKLSEIKFR